MDGWSEAMRMGAFTIVSAVRAPRTPAYWTGNFAL
jgi:hypothetical protein